MVVALDTATAEWLKARNFAYYTKPLTSRTGSTDNHATSGLKFKACLRPGSSIPLQPPLQTLLRFLKSSLRARSSWSPLPPPPLLRPRRL